MHFLSATYFLALALSSTTAFAAQAPAPANNVERQITASSLIPGVSSIPGISSINPSTFDTSAVSGTVSQGVITESASAIATTKGATVTTKANGMSTTISDDAGATAAAVAGNLGVLGGLAVVLLGL